MIDYHGWTHRPKAQGGTDPVPAAVPSLPRATGLGAKTVASGTFDSYVSIQDGSVVTEDAATFEEDLTLDGIKILRSGIYQVIATGQVDTSSLANYPTSLRLTWTSGTSGGFLFSEDSIITKFIAGATSDVCQPPSMMSTKRFTSGGLPRTIRPYIKSSAGAGAWSIDFVLTIYRLGDLDT